MQKSILFTLLVFIVAGFASGQEKVISQDEYNTVYYKALDKGRELPRRHVSKEESIRDGRVVATREWLNEYALPFKSRVVYKVTNEEGTKGFEEISIDENTYCRSLNKEWTISATACKRGFAVSTQQAFQVLGKISTKNMVEDVLVDGKKLKQYKEVINYRNQSPNSTDSGTMFIAENAFWLNDKGMISRQEITTKIAGMNKPSLIWIDIYDYDPKVKIEAPIK